jgi:hypothetical protein
MHKDLSIQARKHRKSENDDDTVNMGGVSFMYEGKSRKKKKTKVESKDVEARGYGYYSKQKVEKKKCVWVQRRRGLELLLFSIRW